MWLRRIGRIPLLLSSWVSTSLARLHGIGQACWLLGLCIDRRLFTECHNTDLHEPHQIRGGMRPFVEVWKINLARSVHMFTHFDLHVRGWLDIAEWRMVGVSVEQVQRDWDVVVLTPVWHRDRTLNVDKVPLLAVIESEFVFLGSQSLVVVEQGLNLSLGQLRMTVVDLRENRGNI